MNGYGWIISATVGENKRGEINKELCHSVRVFVFYVIGFVVNFIPFLIFIQFFY